MRLVDADNLYEKACDLEAQALSYVGKIGNDESKLEEWKIWSAILAERTAFKHDVYDAPTIEPGPQWIPLRTRPMTEEERQYWEEHTGAELEDEDAVFFDCQMPDDGQEVWVCYKSGTVSEDVCERDDFCGLEGNGDWLDIVAWMPRIKPEPYREEDNENGFY